MAVLLRDIIIIAFLAGWFIASIFSQPRYSTLLKTRWYGFGGLVPNYRFFAPKPISFDYQILYRTVRGDGLAGEWIPIVVPAKPFYCWLWNPHQRLKKGVYDLVMVLFRYKQSNWSNIIHISNPYILILNHITSITRSEDTSVQFIVTKSDGFQNKEEHVFFASYVHRHSD